MQVQCVPRLLLTRVIFLSISNRCEFKQYQPPISSKEQCLALLRQFPLWLWQQLHLQNRLKISYEHWFANGSLSKNFPESVVILHPTAQDYLTAVMARDWTRFCHVACLESALWCLGRNSTATDAVATKQNVSVHMCKAKFCGIDHLRKVFLFFVLFPSEGLFNIISVHFGLQTKQLILGLP